MLALGGLALLGGSLSIPAQAAPGAGSAHQGTNISTVSVQASSSLTFTEHTITDSFDGARSVYATDVDGDGDVDVLGAASNADAITWWENDGSENFTGHTIDDNFDRAGSVYATDVDGDGDMDVLGAAYYADDITWWENDGSESFTGYTIDDNFNGAFSVYATDVDGDGDVDVLGAAHADGITWWENDGSESFAGHTITDSFGEFSAYATDVDGDGDVDVLGAGNNPDDISWISWWENDGSENFAGHTIDDNFNGATSVYATDVDGDGDVDVLGAAHFADDITWWENDGSENFTEHTIDDNFNGAIFVYATDVDGDGDVDVLGAAQVDGITWWENTGRGAVVEVDPDSGGELVYTDAHGSPTSLEIPAEAVTKTTTILYTPRHPQAVPDFIPGLAPGGHVFDLVAYREEKPIPDFVFEKTVTLTIEYSEEDVVMLEEDTLTLYRWTGDEWEKIGARPVETYTLDAEDDRLTAYLVSLGRFSTLGVGGDYLFLPLVFRE